MLKEVIQMKRIVAFVLCILILVCFSACDESYVSNEPSDDLTISSDASTDKNPQSKGETESTEETPESYIEQFVENYNKVASKPIENRKEFDPKNQDSGYYRTEYRLTAWDGSTGEAATIGNVKIEMVNYGSYGGYGDNDEFRVYATADTVDELLLIFPDMAKVLDTITYEIMTSISSRVKRIYTER